jgi:hypothetical protein
MALCTEVPRYRQDERFRVVETIEIEGGGPANLIDISVHGARIAAPVTPELTQFRWRGLPAISARRLRQQGDTASYCFEIDDETARLLTVEIYATGLRATGQRVQLPTLLRNFVCRFILRSGAGR